MKVYRWEETEDRVIAIVRPDALFDMSTIADGRRNRNDGTLVARHRSTGELGYVGFWWKKGRLRVFIDAEMERMPELYLRNDEVEMRRLNAAGRPTG